MLNAQPACEVPESRFVRTCSCNPQPDVRALRRNLRHGGDDPLVAFVSLQPANGNDQVFIHGFSRVEWNVREVVAVRNKRELLWWDAQALAKEGHLKLSNGNQPSCTAEQWPQQPLMKTAQGVTEARRVAASMKCDNI